MKIDIAIIMMGFTIDIFYCSVFVLSCVVSLVSFGCWEDQYLIDFQQIEPKFVLVMPLAGTGILLVDLDLVTNVARAVVQNWLHIKFACIEAHSPHLVFKFS